MTETPTPPDTDLTYHVIEACARSPDHEDLVLSPDRHYDELTDAEEQFHRGVNTILGACDIPDPLGVGDYYGVVLDDHARSRFEVGESYTPDELVAVCVALFEDIQEFMQSIQDLFADLKHPTPKRLSLVSPDGESVETDEVSFATYADPFTAICMADGLPEGDYTGWEAVCSDDGEVVFSGVVDAVRGPDDDDVVELDCVGADDE